MTDSINLLNQAAELADEGQTAAARRLVQQAIRLDPDDAEAWWALAQVAVSEGERNIALHEVLKRNPDHVHALHMQDQIRAGTLPSPGTPSLDKIKQHVPQAADDSEKRYYTPAMLTLMGYLLVGPLAMTANVYFLVDAYRTRRETGAAPAGLGCLWAMLITHVILLALVVLSVLILLSLGDDLWNQIRLYLNW